MKYVRITGSVGNSMNSELYSGTTGIFIIN